MLYHTRLFPYRFIHFFLNTGRGKGVSFLIEVAVLCRHYWPYWPYYSSRGDVDPREDRLGELNLRRLVDSMGCSLSRHSATSQATSFPSRNEAIVAENDETSTINIRLVEEQLEHSILKDGVSILVKSSSVRTALGIFLKNEYRNSSQSLASMLDRLEIGNLNYALLATKADSIISTYESSAPEINIRRSGETFGTEVGGDGGVQIMESPARARSRRRSVTTSVYSTQMKCLLILSVFPYFSLSKAYEDWCEGEWENRAKVQSTSSEDTIFVKSLRSLTRLNSLDRTSSTSAIDRFIDSIVQPEVSSFLSIKSWLHAFFNIVEDLPVCITLAAACKSQRGFPLIYVNRMFQQTTGYQKSEIIGRNCKFLQNGGYSEQTQILKIAEALREERPIRVKISNFKKDGTPFKNLLALKPIFDVDGKYCFVVGVQMDCSSETTDAEQIALVDDIIYAIPNVMYCPPCKS